MGLFSFLKKGADTVETGGNTAAPTGVQSPPDASAAAAAVATAVPEESPFEAPAEWNIEAFTAPPPPTLRVDEATIGPVDPVQTAALQPQIVEVLKTVYDPEIPVDIYELGLIYEILVDAERRVLVKMTLTSPACPSAQQLPSEARYKVKAVPGVTDAWVEIVWEPPWSKDLMSEAAKLQLGFF